MRNALPTTGLIAHSKALEAAGIAISLVLGVPAPLKSLADQVIRSASRYLRISPRATEDPVAIETTTGASPMHPPKRSTHIFASSSALARSIHRRPIRQSVSSTKSEPSPGASSTRNSDVEVTREGASLGVPGSALCRIDPPARGALSTMPYRAPPGSAMNSNLPAQKQAAGVPSAGSQPFQFSTDATPPMGRRRAAEGGPEGRNRENRDQRQRPGQRPGAAFGHVTDDSQDGCRYTIKNGRCVATGFQPVGGRGSGRDSGRCRPGSEEKNRPSGCRVRHCAGSTPRHAVRCAQCRTGLPRGAR